jgi:FAD/FMN-containing dehydrogenase
VIIESSGQDDTVEREKIEALLAQGFEAGWITDATIAASYEQARQIWAMRDEGPAEYGQLFSEIIPFDVSIPIARMVESTERITSAIRGGWPDAIPLTYGHIGDANLHLVVGFKAPIPEETKAGICEVVYNEVGAAGGAISAEHGIGQLKKQWLPLSRTPVAIDLMRRMKQALDPNGILNPGRVI